MHALDMIENGHQLMIEAASTLDSIDQQTRLVHGTWTAKDVIAHLVSYEYLLVDALMSVRSHHQASTLELWRTSPQTFDDSEVEYRKNMSIGELIHEYMDHHFLAIDLLIHIPEHQLRQPGVMPWYSSTCDVEDFIAYASYAHKHEHCAQIKVQQSKRQLNRERIEFMAQAN